MTSEPSAPDPGLLAGDAVADVWDRVNIYDGGETFLKDLAAISEHKRHLVVACIFRLIVVRVSSAT
jgi:hypothetical protein